MSTEIVQASATIIDPTEARRQRGLAIPRAERSDTFP
jgi:hypothetical protein